jgi:hypothetical protein
LAGFSSSLPVGGTLLPGQRIQERPDGKEKVYGSIP